MQHQPVFKLHPVRLPVEPPLVSDRDFLWVELHRKYTAQNMLESKSSQVLCVRLIYAEQMFPWKPLDIQRSNGTEIDYS